MTNSIGIITNKVQPKVLGSKHFLYHDTVMTMVILQCTKQKIQWNASSSTGKQKEPCSVQYNTAQDQTGYTVTSHQELSA
jgi:hypothetical protein